MANGPSFVSKEADGNPDLDIRLLVYAYLEAQLSDEAEKVRKKRESLEFAFSFAIRMLAAIAALIAVFFLYFQVHQIIIATPDLLHAEQANLAILVSGILISAAMILGIMIASVFRNAGDKKTPHPLQNFLSNPEVGRLFNLSVQAPLD